MIKIKEPWPEITWAGKPFALAYSVFILTVGLPVLALMLVVLIAEIVESLAIKTQKQTKVIIEMINIFARKTKICDAAYAGMKLIKKRFGKGEQSHDPETI